MPHNHHQDSKIFSLNASETKKRRWNSGRVAVDEDDSEEGDATSASDKRQAFTPGWSKFLTAKEALPIKIAGKVVRTYIEEQDMPVTEEDESADDDKAEIDDIGDDDGSESEGSFDYATEKPVKAKPSNKNTSMHSSETVQLRSFSNLNEAKLFIGTICCGVTSDPEKALTKRKVKGSEYFEDDQPRLTDLFELLSHSDSRIVEMCMLSLLLVFKDICPSYRIRLENIDVQLKKDTKRKRDIDKQLLDSYRKYITFLDSVARDGLGDSRKAVTLWTPEATLGLSAYRCQCELLRSLYHFNFRSIILNAVISRAAQPNEEVYKTCYSALEFVFKNDAEGEVSFEIVRAIAQNLAQIKYNVSEEYIKILSRVKLHVHARDAESVRKAAKARHKKNKKKSKSEEDDAENDLLQAEATNKTTMKRFQLDSLHEICLIYFRIIKNKIGFDLFPVALEGMGKISHLVNIDSMEDLVLVLKNYLPAASNTPTLVQLHCIHCALQVLSGPGSELEMDVDPFVDSLHDILAELSGDFPHWDIVIRCIDFALLRRKETRPDVCFLIFNSRRICILICASDLIIHLFVI